MVRGKRREELYISVPSLFRCPISMDVMKSPVSLCTGVTYDRSSIEKWLALGHNTCPATMQTLPSTHTTPNLTLRRLIHLWLSQAEVIQASTSLSSSSSSSSSVISKQQLADVINGKLEPDSLEKVIGFATASEENLKFVAQSSDAISRLVQVLANIGEIRVYELIVEILDLISRENGVIERLNELILKSYDERDCLSSFILLLEKGSVESKVKCARILELIAVNTESQRKIAEKPGLLYAFYNLITVETDTSTTEACLSALLAISDSRLVKKELIRFGLVGRVGKILCSFENDHSSAVRTVIEKALRILAVVATCTEGRSAICEDEECVAGILKRLMKCSSVAAEHGIRILWIICCLGRDPNAEEKVEKVNGLTKVLLVMQSDCSVNTRQMCRELVKVLRANNIKSNLAPYQTKTTHISPY